MSISGDDIIRVWALAALQAVRTFGGLDKDWNSFVGFVMVGLIAYTVSAFISRNLHDHEYQKIQRMMWENSEEGKRKMKESYKEWLKKHPEMDTKRDDEKGEKE